MLSHLCDLQSTQRTSEGMHVDRARAADLALNRRACDRAGLRIVAMQDELYLLDNAGRECWFNPLRVDKHTQILFDAMGFTVAGRFLARRLVSSAGLSVRVLFGRGKAWRKLVVEFAAAHPSKRSDLPPTPAP